MEARRMVGMDTGSIAGFLIVTMLLVTSGLQTVLAAVSGPNSCVAGSPIYLAEKVPLQNTVFKQGTC